VVAKQSASENDDAVALPRPAGFPPFEDLFREHAPGLLRLIRSRLHEHGAADDVLQETFVRFYRFYVLPGRLDPSRPVAPLLATIATREAARRSRALAHQRRLDSLHRPEATSAAVGSDEHVAALHEGPIVRTVLGGLDPRHQRLLVQWAARRSTATLATAEQLSVPALKQVVVRARRTFRERYEAACAKAGGLASAVVPRLRLPWARHDLAATGVGLFACSVALAAVTVGEGAGPSGASEVAAGHAVTVVVLPPAGGPPPPAATRTDPPTLPPRATPSRFAPSDVDAAGTGVRLSGNGAAVGVVADDPQGNTRSINSFTVICDAGITAGLACLAVDQLPPGLSGGGDA
jgi:DNA-directed RNA polymerase specialized sigma24 family protein